MDEQTKRELRQYVERWRLAAPALDLAIGATECEAGILNASPRLRV
jgi:hypothetical protein